MLVDVLISVGCWCKTEKQRRLIATANGDNSSSKNAGLCFYSCQTLNERDLVSKAASEIEPILTFQLPLITSAKKEEYDEELRAVSMWALCSHCDLGPLRGRLESGCV